MDFEILLMDNNLSEKQFKQCVELLLQQMNFINSASTADKVTRGFQLGLDNPETTKIFAVISPDNDVVGIAYANKAISIEKSGYYLWINELHVKTTMRRKGIATLLITYIIDWGKKEKMKSICLISDIDNEIALDFYYKHGFEAEDVLFFTKALEVN